MPNYVVRSLRLLRPSYLPFQSVGCPLRRRLKCSPHCRSGSCSPRAFSPSPPPGARVSSPQLRRDESRNTLSEAQWSMRRAGLQGSMRLRVSPALWDGACQRGGVFAPYVPPPHLSFALHMSSVRVLFEQWRDAARNRTAPHLAHTARHVLACCSDMGCDSGDAQTCGPVNIL